MAKCNCSIEHPERPLKGHEAPSLEAFPERQLLSVWQRKRKGSNHSNPRALPLNECLILGQPARHESAQVRELQLMLNRRHQKSGHEPTGRVPCHG